MLRAEQGRADRPVTSGLRVRLTVVFALAMAAVLVASGSFVYLRLSGELLAAVDRDLGARSDALVSALARVPTVLLAGTHRFADPDEAFAQVLDRSGRVRDATPGLPTGPLLNAADVRTLTAPLFVTRPARQGADAERLLAVPLAARADSPVVVVGATLGDRADALAQLARALVLVGVVATALACWGAWLLAGAALAPVDAAVRRERRLVDDASHELRTPLAVVKAELDLALSRPRSREELRSTVETAARETDRLVRLTEDLLVVARERQGSLPLHAQPTGLPQLVRSAVAGLTGSATRSGRTVTVEADDAVVVVDPDRVRQILVNLVDNAIRHGTGTIVVRAEVTAGHLHLDVHDEGAGLPAPLRDSAFEPFQRGAGLGLAIVRAIADAGHGQVVPYADASGSGVRVELPVRPAPGASALGQPGAAGTPTG